MLSKNDDVTPKSFALNIIIIIIISHCDKSIAVCVLNSRHDAWKLWYVWMEFVVQHNGSFLYFECYINHSVFCLLLHVHRSHPPIWLSIQSREKRGTAKYFRWKNHKEIKRFFVIWRKLMAYTNSGFIFNYGAFFVSFAQMFYWWTFSIYAVENVSFQEILTLSVQDMLLPSGRLIHYKEFHQSIWSERGSWSKKWLIV